MIDRPEPREGARVLFISDYDDPNAWRRELSALLPGLDFVLWSPDIIPELVDFALAYKPPAGLLKRLPNLQAVLSLAAGLDHLEGDRGPQPHVPIVKLEDPGFARIMAEYVLAAVLRHHREFPRYAELQSRSLWTFEAPLPASARRVGIIGLGQMGLASARLLRQVGFKVSAWSRTARNPDEPAFEGLTLMSGAAGLLDMAAETDILVCLLPLTVETSGIIDEGLLSRLPQGAALVNVGRGQHIVADALVSALDRGSLAGATLDVLEREPPPAGDPLWTHPKIFVTPHVATFPRPETAAAAVARSIERFWRAAGPT
ncbi:MAG: glyoxylate/hydroxypyruvate reductase A [Beijerinckiaceae bacterium]|nr:glyoxylate/hydroxypyruvate reductase A [Beijerinckiaceae bacterium]